MEHASAALSVAIPAQLAAHTGSLSDAVYALRSAVAALADSMICTYGGKLVTLPYSHDVLPMMPGRTRTCWSAIPPLSCAAACISRGAVMCRFDGVLLCLLWSVSYAVRVSALGLKTPFAKVAGSSALLIGKLGPAATQNCQRLATML